MSLLDHAPTLTPDQAQALAAQAYGLNVRADLLPSERDQNFRLDVDGSPAYVLKVANATETEQTLGAQNEAAAVARAAGLPVQRLVPTVQGRDFAAAGAHLVRLLDWLPGVPLASVAYTPGLLGDLGATLGRLARALAGFDHPAAHREFHWDVARAGAVVPGLLGAVTDPVRRALVEDFLAGFAPVAAALPGLRRAVIHGDANDLNVLVTTDQTEPTVCGLLDFGDLVHSLVVAEPAVAAAYVVHRSADPLTAACQLVAGFHREYPLTEPELDVLWELVRAREVLSACHAATQHAARPDDPYLTVSEGPAWRALARMRDIHPRLARYRLRDACGFDPHPGAAAVRRHLAASSPAPLLTGLASSRRFAVDLTVNSPTVRPADAGAAPADFDRLIRSVVGGDPNAVGHGGYGEQRLIYTGPDYEAEYEAEYESGGDSAGERRSVHLAVDVWAAAQTPVCALLPGVVALVRNNTARLDYGPVVVLRHATTDGVEFFSLYGHLALATLDQVTAGQPVAAGDVIGWVGTPPTNGDWAPHVHLQLIVDLLDLAHDYPGVALPSQRSTWLGLSPDPELVLRLHG